MDNGREFWLFKDGKGVKDPDYQSLKPDASIAHEFIHTIEMSAYTKLKSERDAAVEALKFYGNKDNWFRDKNGWRHDMIIKDLDDESLTDWNGRFSGKRARAVLAMIDKGEK